MLPRPITDSDLVYWEDLQPHPTTFAPPLGEGECGPCPALITRDSQETGHHVVRVPWVLDEIELVHLAKGGTLWLSTWDGLPMHMLEVQAPA